MDKIFPLHYWPILTSLWILSTFLISYLVAVFDNHVYELFPYISDTGTIPPESCIFAQMLNIGAVLMLVTVYIRFKTMQLVSHKGLHKNYTMWNNWSNFFGILSCFGLSLVANFQQTSEINVHLFGAFLTFAVGAVYCVIQAYLTCITYSSKFLKCIRILLSLFLIALYVSTTVCSTLSFEKFDGKHAFMWSHNDAGYELHLVATFSEWAIAILMISYIATYYVEFKLVDFKGISFVLKNE